MKKNDKNHRASKKILISDICIKSEMPPNQLSQILSKNPSIINSTDYKGETILSYALNNNNNEILDLLLNSPLLNLNYKDSKGNSYLHLAVMNQNENFLKKLVAKGINLNVQNNVGNTALHIAYEYGNSTIKKILIDNGINIVIKNNENKMAKEIKEKMMNKNKSVKFYSTLNKTAKSNKTRKTIIKPLRKDVYNNVGYSSNKNMNNNIINNNMYKNIFKVYSKYFRNDHYLIAKNNKQLKTKNIKNKHLELTDQKKKKENISLCEPCINDDNDNIEQYFKYLSYRDYNSNINSNNINNINSNKVEDQNSIKYMDNIIINTSNETKFVTDTKEKTNNNIDDISSLNNQSLEIKKCHNNKEKKNEYVNYLLYEKNNLNEKNNKNKKKSLGKNSKSFIHLKAGKCNTVQSKYSPKNKTEKHTTDNLFKYKVDKNFNINDNNNYNNSNKKHKINSNKIINKTITKVKSEISFINHTNVKNKSTKKNLTTEKNEDLDINHILKKRKINKIQRKELFFKKKPHYTESNKKISMKEEEKNKKKNQKNQQISVNNNNNTNTNNCTIVDENYLTLKSRNSLRNFLSQIYMLKYMGIFAMNGFDDINLILEQSKNGTSSIQDSELKEAGIKIPGDRAKILIRIQELSNNFIFPIPKEVYYYLDDKKTNIDNDHNINKLKEWLKSIKLEQFLMNFVNCGYYSLELLLIQIASSNPITNEILKEEIGIGKVGYRSRIINKLKDDSRSYINELTINFVAPNKGEEKTTNCQCIIF